MNKIRNEKLHAAMILSTFLMICAVQTGWPATFYIDYNSGNDLANGTSKATPWQRCPWMHGFAGAYSHVAGDQFIFKGGVTWPNACFRMVIGNGGSVGNVDYYGVDATWYTGGAWARPIFDAGGTRITNGGANSFLYAGGSLSYITFDNIEFTGLYWDSSDVNWVDAKILLAGDLTYSTFKNLYFHGWSHSSFAAGGRDIMYCILGVTSSPWNPGTVVDSCTFDGTSSSGDSGTATYGGLETIRYSTAHDMPCGFESAGSSSSHVLHDCLIFNNGHSFDPTMHEDATFFMGAGKVYNNVIHDVWAGMALYPVPGWANEQGDQLIYNNVVWNYSGSGNGPLTVDCAQYNYSGTVRLFNNTIYGVNGATGSCVRVVDRTYTIANLYIQNNHFITSAASPTAIDGPVTDLTDDHNVKQTVAQASSQMYTIGNEFAATISTGSTVDVGRDLSTYFTTDIKGISRGLGAAWDVGAYEYNVSSGTLVPPSGIRIKE